ncbi:hypothetical protein LWC05_12950 [Acetobacter sicerae]|uniref:Uncharacterized protein n=1 Tax=Acetobacter sicerae TaxID=85325 RepID=A0ABS8VUW7_9PROT|nr:hypothetical protein [Acetobacter sicerae]MCE0744788.1 hypothetical protein [Acetobacter sicerae]
MYGAGEKFLREVGTGSKELHLFGECGLKVHLERFPVAASAFRKSPTCWLWSGGYRQAETSLAAATD